MFYCKNKGSAAVFILNIYHIRCMYIYIYIHICCKGYKTAYKYISIS